MAGRGSAAGQPLNTASHPRRAHYLICLGMGATVGFVAAFGESFYEPLAIPVLIFSQALFPIVVATAIAPLVEEPAESLGLLLLKEEEKLNFEIKDWTILGSLSGIGFGFMENVFYALAVLGYGVNVSLALFLMRGLLTAPLHGITTTRHYLAAYHPSLLPGSRLGCFRNVGTRNFSKHWLAGRL